MILFCLFCPILAQASLCSYHTYSWNVIRKQAENRKFISHPYAELLPVEVHQETGCTVCRQDQVQLVLPGIEPFLLCKHLEQKVRLALLQALQQGAKIYSVETYRVGMTRGPTDDQGNRTQFSNHSFGIALDINAEQNGLYDRCIEFGSHCRLRRGGHWIPGQQGSLMVNGPIVRALLNVGFKWGGEILGKQKDFMHFSPSGY